MCSLCSTVCSQSSLLPLGLSVGLSVCRSGHMTTSTSTSSNCSSPCVCVQPAHTHSHTEQETKPSLSWAAPCSAACVWVCVPAGSGAVEARHGRSEERTRSDRLPAEKPRCGRHAAVGAAHLLRQVCGGTERRQTEQHRPHRGRRPGRPAGRDGEWTRLNTPLIYNHLYWSRRIYDDVRLSVYSHLDEVQSHFIRLYSVFISWLSIVCHYRREVWQSAASHVVVMKINRSIELIDRKFIFKEALKTAHTLLIRASVARLGWWFLKSNNRSKSAQIDPEIYL